MLGTKINSFGNGYLPVTIIPSRTQRNRLSLSFMMAPRTNLDRFPSKMAQLCPAPVKTEVSDYTPIRLLHQYHYKLLIIKLNIINWSNPNMRLAAT